MKSAERRGVPFGRRYSRRLLGLLILGMLHVTFAFVGDILIIYALVGALLYAFKGKTVKSLMRWGIGLLILQIIIVLLLAGALYAGEIYAPEEMAKDVAESTAGLPVYYAVYGQGSLLDVMAFRWKDWAGYLAFAGPIQVPGILAFFILGLALVKSDLIANPSASIWSKARRIAFPIGLVLSGFAAYLMGQPTPYYQANRSLLWRLFSWAHPSLHLAIWAGLRNGLQVLTAPLGRLSPAPGRPL